MRPRGRVLAEFAGLVRRLDLDQTAALGPRTTAATIVPHEFVRPYDPASYGLDVEPAGTYRPAETAWAPDRDARPLVRAWLNAFVLASRAGLSVSFPRESLDGAWPSARLLLLPAPLASTSNSLLHVRTSFWQGANAFLASGGTLYLSCSADVAVPEMETLMGCRVRDRAPARDVVTLRFVRSWGPLEPGAEIRLPAANDDLTTRGVSLGVSDGLVVAEDEEGAPALVVAERGVGRVVTLSFPLELLLARMPDAHGPDDPTWTLYAGLADLAGGRDEAWADHPDVTTGTLRGEQGGLTTMTNHAADAVTVPVHLPPGARSPELVVREGARTVPMADGVVEVALDPYGAAVLTWQEEG
jgi:hypothetical protein